MFQRFQEHQYTISKEKGDELNSTIKLLEQTSTLVKIFNSLVPIKDVTDPRLKSLADVLAFFEAWEEEAKLKKIASTALFSAQCREDLQCTILGFMELCKSHLKHYGSSIIPGRVNSDIVENT